MMSWLKDTFRHAAWAPLTLFFFYVVAANGFDAYLLYPWLDMPTHFFGGMAITYFFLIATAYAQALVGSIPKPIQLLVSLGLTAMTAVAWEFFEYVADIALHTKMNFGVADTLADLFFGLLGGVVLLTIGVKSSLVPTATPHRMDSRDVAATTDPSGPFP